MQKKAVYILAGDGRQPGQGWATVTVHGADLSAQDNAAAVVSDLTDQAKRNPNPKKTIDRPADIKIDADGKGKGAAAILTFPTGFFHVRADLIGI
jgi:hypothetical protein